ncbi:uncharacterized protein LOC121249261 [Juglans microcarpa x Juglans regia]|uniref:uncharacterized protein LOC121249261 n=1 Tax=Juglans microcarpa x Juglans regia TaxID=2249226 RepID=UPI001B7DB0C1|nr:uncharacterized protein LOC121249261 [Juglans microcarpa x Juglans regia]
MEVCNPKGGRTAAPAFPTMLLMIMMLLNAYCCGTAVLVKSNISFQCNGDRLDECLIKEELELELGFLMNPYVSRILGGQGKDPQTDNRNKPAFNEPCGKSGDPQYDTCTFIWADSLICGDCG